MNLKDMINQAISEVGFAELTEFFGSTKTENRQLRRLADRELFKLQKKEWQVLRSTLTINMTASESYSLPSDFRQFVPDTAFSTTRRVNFPASSESWSYYKSRNVSTGLNHRMRLYQGNLQIENPQAGGEIRIEYISNNAVADSDGVPKPKFTSDNDVTVLNDDLFMMGIMWRFGRAKGLKTWESLRQDYDRAVRSELATDSGSQTINTGDSGGMILTEPHADLLI
jgi:hypothetical protein